MKKILLVVLLSLFISTGCVNDNINKDIPQINQGLDKDLNYHNEVSTKYLNLLYGISDILHSEKDMIADYKNRTINSYQAQLKIEEINNLILINQTYLEDEFVMPTFLNFEESQLFQNIKNNMRAILYLSNNNLDILSDALKTGLIKTSDSETIINNKITINSSLEEIDKSITQLNLVFDKK